MSAFVRIDKHVWIRNYHSECIADAIETLGEEAVERAFDDGRLIFGKMFGTMSTVLPESDQEARRVFYQLGGGRDQIEEELCFRSKEF